MKEQDRTAFDHLAKPAKQKRRFTLKPFAAVKISKIPNYLVKGVLPRTGLVVVWGPPKCGKSFWVFDLVMHVAIGRKYRDRRTQQGRLSISPWKAAQASPTGSKRGAGAASPNTIRPCRSFSSIRRSPWSMTIAT
jgi:hypothetical protein